MTANMMALMVKSFKIKSPLLRQCLAESFGTFMLILMGNAAVAQAVLTNFVSNSFLGVIIGYAIGVTLGVMVSIGVSGAHLNPAVSVAMAFFGRFPWMKVIPYVIAQILGAFLASAVVYVAYYDALVAFEDTPSQLTAGIWSTYPGSIITPNGTAQQHLTLRGGLIDQILGTCILLMCICSINDQKNAKIPSSSAPVLVGLTIAAIGLSFGFNCGFAINPARDLGPRIFTLLAGWGSISFSATTVDGYVWWWVPIVGPIIGAILGMFIYIFVIELHHPEEEKEVTQCSKEEMSKGCC